ncbi:MAG: polysaccharide deacetylase family protein [Deltaproteobacteria bacterium]|nr:polysaccharide deacetylase family protein [Deltaproteobacteria bacterium]
MTIDVEEWFQVENLRSHFPPETWERAERRLDFSMQRIFDTLESEKVAGATFFVLGWIAERSPDWVRRMVDAGYEVASHGMDHVSNFDQTAEQRAWNLSQSKNFWKRFPARR